MGKGWLHGEQLYSKANKTYLNLTLGLGKNNPLRKRWGKSRN